MPPRNQQSSFRRSAWLRSALGGLFLAVLTTAPCLAGQPLSAEQARAFERHCNRAEPESLTIEEIRSCDYEPERANAEPTSDEPGPGLAEQLTDLLQRNGHWREIPTEDFASLVSRELEGFAIETACEP